MTADSKSTVSLDFDDKVAGAVLGAAIGDAMGHPTEFCSMDEIRDRYGPHGVQGFELFWEKGGRHYLCLIWNMLPNSRIDGVDIPRQIIDGPARTITLRFSDAVAGLRNLRTGRDLGAGTDFDDTWLPCEANVYEVELR